MKFKSIMSFLLLIFLFLSLSCSHHSVVDQPNRSTSSESSLNQMNWNRFVQAEPMPANGKFKGQTVETKRRRAILFLGVLLYF